jgi:hypothetical protein
MKLFFNTLFIFLLATINGYAFQPDSTKKEYYDPSFFRYENYVYTNNIKTVLLYPENWEMAPPVIQLNGYEKLKFSFDDLDADVKNYYYTIIHCDASWNPSDISPSEYIEGYREDEIFDAKPSFNTMQRYTHYNLIFPNDVMKITQTGNYILKVYLDNDPQKYVITKRFMVYERKVDIDVNIKQASQITERNYKQEIDFVIRHANYKIQDPYNDLKVVITQNDRWDNAVNNLKPLFVNDNTLTYDYDEDNVFVGGSEFRYFETKSLLHPSIRIRHLLFDTAYQVYLYDDERLTFKRYSTANDINGKYVIRAENYDQPEINADYAYIHFRLPVTEAITEGSLYVFGSLSDYRFTPECKMKYNSVLNLYETSVYLKQGYYDYQYILLRDEEKGGDASFIEGSHYETENDYSIYVYNKEFGTGFDKLVGYVRLKSNR